MNPIMISGLSFWTCCLLPTELFVEDKPDQFPHPGGLRVEANLCSARQSGSGQKKSQWAPTLHRWWTRRSNPVWLTWLRPAGSAVPRGRAWCSAGCPEGWSSTPPAGSGSGCCSLCSVAAYLSTVGGHKLTWKKVDLVTSVTFSDWQNKTISQVSQETRFFNIILWI